MRVVPVATHGVILNMDGDVCLFLTCPDDWN